MSEHKIIALTVTDKSYVNKLLSRVHTNIEEMKGTAVTQMPNNEL
jgi:hypothetical protein